MRRRKLTAEETALWRGVTRDVRKLAPSQSLSPTDDKSKLEAAARNASNNLGDDRIRRAIAVPSAPSGSARTRPPDIFAAGDPSMDRRVRRGKLAIDATFDLHGHTQATARAALYGFLLEARARRYRCVLIITGKGAGSGRDLSLSRGILRQRFREWMQEPEFRQHVTRVTVSDHRHGGDGAFYVFFSRAKAKKA